MKPAISMPDESTLEYEFRFKQVKVFMWNCPDCGLNLEGDRLPDSQDDACCRDCDNLRYQKRAIEWINAFKINRLWLKDAKVIDFQPYTDDWYNETPDMAEVVEITLQLADGQIYKVSTNSDVPYLYMSKKGR
jgi:hypothetical protein